LLWPSSSWAAIDGFGAAEDDVAAAGRHPSLRSGGRPQLNVNNIGQTMTAIHDSLLTGYVVDGAGRSIILYARPHGGGGAALDVKFTGVVAYHFEGDCLQNIVFDVVEVTPEDIVGDGRTLVERNRQHGWPRGWASAAEGAAQFLRRQGCRCFEISASYDMNGWVAAAGWRCFRWKDADEEAAQ
jgi:hypothetical protein